MPDPDQLTIKLTPRMAAYLKALAVAHEARLAEHRKEIEDEKAERLKAAAEGRPPPYHPIAHGMCAHAAPLAELTFEQIAALALERGAADILHSLTRPPLLAEPIGPSAPMYLAGPRGY